MENLKIIYDIQSCPRESDMKQIVDIATTSKIVLWDSANKGVEPKIVEDVDLQVINSQTDKGKQILKKYK
jgi:GH25 family lysozyme M1 (1,4-beta-N-acetylmuramidase)